jgi:disulfide bond formation protein DsbB
MADTSDPNTAPVSPQRPNPSVESTRRDDERARDLHQHAQAMGTVACTGLGCLGMAVIPWVAVILGTLAAVVFVLIKKEM